MDGLVSNSNNVNHNLPDLARLLAPLIKESMNQVLAEPIESSQNLEPTTQNV